MNTWIFAILPIAGVIVGAALQFWFGRAAELRKQLEVHRAESYVDYLRAVAQAAHAKSIDESQSAKKAGADAKARIVVFGTAAVVVALSNFEKVGPVLDNDRSRHAFAALASAMRQKAERVSMQEIEVVLTGAAQQAEAVTQATEDG